jgi:hypothetical protein
VTIEVVEEGGEGWTGSGRRHRWPMDSGWDRRNRARRMGRRRKRKTLERSPPREGFTQSIRFLVQSRSFKSLFNSNCNRNPSTSV